MAEPVAPIGAREDQRIEFKRADALGKLEPISQAVVSMLNAEGGDVWIGVIEKDERWVDTQDVPDVENQGRRVHDHLMSAIEPSPLGREVRVETFAIGERRILVVRVERGERGPYALLKGGGRHFALRVGGRSRPMTHSELVTAFAGRAEVQDGLRTLREQSEKAWEQESSEALKNGRRELWLRVAFSPSLELPAKGKTQEKLTSWLQNPLETSNRVAGWSFTSAYESFAPLSGGRGFKAGGPDAGTWIEVGLDGEIVLRAPIERVAHRAADELYPYALVELPVSVIRLAVVLHREFQVDPEGDVLVDLGLLGVRGLHIRPDHPGSIQHELDVRAIQDDSVRAGPVHETIASMCDRPDALGWKAVSALYFSLGLLPERMPHDIYDSRLGRVHFPR